MTLAFFILLFPWLVQAADLAHSPEWLHLLHMRKNIWGTYQSTVQGEGFFLSPRGSQDPEAELKETQEQMFSRDEATAQKSQCHFLARRDFLLRTGPPEWKSKVQACAFSDEWLAKLNSTKISLIFATGYMNSAPSSFGHTFLKLQNPANAQGKELLDYGVNFSARTRDIKGALFALYGLTGYFPGAFALLPYHEMIKEYTHLEGRDLWEYELDLTPEEVQRVLFHLLELDKVYFDYYFLDDNCSFALLKLLEVGRPGLKLADDDEGFVIPIDTVKAAKPLIRQVRFRPSLETEWRQRRDDLSSEQLSQLADFYRHPDAHAAESFDTETLSAANYLFSLKEIENHNKWKQLNYDLARLRSQRKQNFPFQIERPNESPAEGPDSSAVEMGFLNQDSKSYGLTEIRFAFHDQMSRNVGASPFSHMEVLGFQWQSSGFAQTWLKRYRLIEMLSTQGIDAFEKPISWSAFVGGDNFAGLNPTRFRHSVGAGVGYSFDLVRDVARISLLASGAYRQNTEEQFHLNPGFDSRLWLLWQPRFRTFANYQYWKDSLNETREVSVFQVIDVTSQLEFRAGWRALEEGPERSIETSFSLVQSFLF